jgi:hypothetical protein
MYRYLIAIPFALVSQVSFAQTELAPPRIIKQPAPLVVVAGEPARFEVGAAVADASHLRRYQWFKNGQVLAGKTSYALSIAAAAATDAAGYNVDVWSVDAGGNRSPVVSSTVAQLTVNPVVVTPPPTDPVDPPPPPPPEPQPTQNLTIKEGRYEVTVAPVQGGFQMSFIPAPTTVPPTDPTDPPPTDPVDPPPTDPVDPPPTDPVPPLPPVSGTRTGLLTIAEQTERAKTRLTSGPFAASCTAMMSRATLGAPLFRMTVDPIAKVDTVTGTGGIAYGWTSTAYGRGDSNTNNSLWDFVTQALDAGNGSAGLAYTWLLKGDQTAPAKAIKIWEDWNNGATILHMYQFSRDGINWSPGTRIFYGKTADGLSGLRPGNFALDMGWIHYGVRNFASAYLTLKQNGYPLTAAQEETVKSLLRKFNRTLVSSLEAWTEWARSNPAHADYLKHASYNHIAEYLTGLAASAAALGGAEGASIFEFVINGTPHDFGEGYNRPLFVPLYQYLENALVLEPGTTNVAYRDLYWKTNWRTYQGSVQHTLGVLERIFQLHYPKAAGFYTNWKSSEGFTVMQSAESYAKYLLGQVTGGSSDVLANQYHSRPALEYAYLYATDPAKKKLFEDALYAPISATKPPRGDYYKNYDSGSCLIGENIRE